ncbi:MAG: isoleucine--tRNA ligase [Chitinophagales bacterium]|nr:isoleucine--tRNA ligase [Chitinophagales bacterium]
MAYSEKNFRESKQLSPSHIESEILQIWNQHQTFEQSIAIREGKNNFVFYEGPPSANGMPGIHHVMARTIKDLVCRYKSLKGFQVERKGGWDTHGLPIELQVEKKLGITKKDIGSKISIAEYNKECREEVMKFKNVWDDLTQKMGYWVDLNNPYVTFENYYIESIWSLLKKLYQKDYLYKGLRIQPFSPAAGTGLSSHELNMPGCYKNVKDVSAVAQFKVKESEHPQFSLLSEKTNGEDFYILAWTTTPWTLPSNTALAIGNKINYLLVKTINPYTHIPVNIILAKDLLGKYLKAENENKDFSLYQNDGKNLPYQILSEFRGSDITGLLYEQLLPYAQPEEGDAFRVIAGDFVTTEDGTGIVHIAPSFGADDMRVAQENGIGSLTLVDRQGKFIDIVTDFAGEPVKEAYLSDEEKEQAKQKQGRDKYLSVDERIVIKLKTENKCFKSEKYEHSYPHCWRTDKPILYYPLDSWFIRVTAAKERMVELNKTINWKPKSTGEGRFGQWLENLVDWNLSRSRYWGTPLPIWRTEDGEEEICIGSIAELKSELSKAQAAGVMGDIDLSEKNLDLHKPFVDDVILVSSKGKAMRRESDLIDVWFDSGAMPYAQWHYPFENEEIFKKSFPADFIAEGVDQTRGWFYTLHAIAVMLYDSVAYKNVMSNGLVLDKNGNKMSKRLGNAVDPFITINKYGADATRWYMISNSQPWDNLKFDIEGLEEVQRKLFSTLHNTYAFFAIYANLDQFKLSQDQIPIHQRPEIDRWIISCLHSLIQEVESAFDDYEPTKAARAIQEFVNDQLSNWYVRLSRRRFWKTEDPQDKIAAYQTLHTALTTISQLMSPIAPFYSDWLYRSLIQAQDNNSASVHLTDFPIAKTERIDKDLEAKMNIAQQLSSLILSLRKRENIKVRQPLAKVLIPIIDSQQEEMVAAVQNLILSEVNIKTIEFVRDTTGIVSKKVKPNFKLLGKKLGAKMKEASNAILEMNAEDINHLETQKTFDLQLSDINYTLLLEEVEIQTEDIAGWLVASDKGWTVALDITLTEELKNEGYARELVNKIQTQRKENDYQVSDRIEIKILNHNIAEKALKAFTDYICNETLADNLLFVSHIDELKTYELNDLEIIMEIKKK